MKVLLSHRFGRRILVKKICTSLLIFLTIFAPSAKAEDSTFLDYQNYNHGYCPTCNCQPCRCEAPPPEEPETYACAPTTPACAPAPCDPAAPCAPVCGTECGISLCAIAVGVVALAVAAVIIATSGSGSAGDPSHS